MNNLDKNYDLEYEKTQHIDVANIISEIATKVTESQDEFIFETIRPYCENIVQMKISKRELVQALVFWRNKEKIIAEIPNLVHWQSEDGQDLVMAYDVIRLLKEGINP